MDVLCGIDLGGTKIEGAILEAADPVRVLARTRVPTRRENGYAAIIQTCAALVSRLTKEAGVHTPKVVGVGSPGSRDPATGLMRNCNTTCLNGKPLQEDLASALHAEVSLTNDANCFALAESRLGAAQGKRCVFGVIIGTGVGGGIVLDGELWEGANRIAGEWGHNLADPGGEPCYCGRRGCVETVLSGPALERWFEQQSGAQLSLAEIVALHRTGGNTPATSTVERLCHEFGLALAQVVNVLDPDAVVLGGGVGQVDELYDQGTRELAKHVFHEDPRIQVVRPTLGDSAGVFGAALLVRTRPDERH